LLLCGFACGADAQPVADRAIPQTETSSNTDDARHTEAHGWNGGITVAGVHDAETGWATMATPAIGYSFNEVFSADLSLPIYMYRLAESNSAKPKPNARLVNQRGEVGDTILTLHAQLLPKHFDFEATGAVAFPSGDEAYGLTSGRVTFDESNHFEHTFQRVTPSLEVGMGDSSTLANRQITKNYTSLGPLAHFEIGFAFPLFHGASFETDTFEDLPVGDQKIYTSITRKGVTTTTVTGRNVSEDNGLINSLDVPLTGNFTLTSYYTRSLRNHDDVVSIGLTYVVRALKPAPNDADIDFDKLFR